LSIIYHIYQINSVSFADHNKQISYCCYCIFYVWKQCIKLSIMNKNGYTFFLPVIDQCHHHHHLCFTSPYHASSNMTDAGFHASVAGTFLPNFFTFTKTWRCGSAGQSVIRSACITAVWLVIEAENLRRMYFLSQPYLCSFCRTHGIHGTR